MDNTSAQLRLVLPKIPASWCPSGSTRAEVFQSYQEAFLKNAYLVIPGVSNIRLLDIANIQSEIVNLQQQYDALNKAVRYGTTALVTNGEVAVSIVPNMPTNDFFLSLTIVSPSGASAAVDHFEVTLKNGSELVTGCTLLCHNVPTNYTVHWKAEQR